MPADNLARSMAAAALQNGGGSGGTTNYNKLTNKPAINGVTLSGNKTAEDLSIHQLPSGGKAGQVLKKTADADYQIEWADAGEAITAEGVLIGDGAGNVSGRPFDAEPTTASENLLTSGAVYAAYSNVLLVADQKIQDKQGNDKTDDVKTALGIVPVAVLTGVLPAGNTVIGLTDAHVTDDVTVEVYTDKYGASPKSVAVENNTVTLTFAAQAEDVNIRVDVGNVTWTTPVQPTDQGDMRKANYDAQGVVAAAGGIPDYVKAKLDELKLDLGSIASIKVVDAQPTNPVRNTLYYVGTENPYHVWLYTTSWYDMGTTDVNLENYAKSDLSNVTGDVFKQKAIDSGIQFPAFEWPTTSIAVPTGVTIMNSTQMKISDNLYFFRADIRLNNGLSSGNFTHICTVNSIPKSSRNDMVALYICPVTGNETRVGCYYYPGTNQIYFVPGVTVGAGYRYVISGLFAIQ